MKMYWTGRTICLLLVVFAGMTLTAPCELCSQEQKAVPVFPAAQGFGIETPAGRGGVLLRVTNLFDSGPGSLREAISQEGPRTIVFEVGGTIHLARDLTIAHPYLTLAGQSAPSPGITLRGAGVSIQSHDVLIQHVRVRVGDLQPGPVPSARDALNIIGPRAYNIVIDHVSTSWAIDENVSTWFPVHDITISHSIISEALHSPLHNKGRHSKGVLIGDHAKNIALVGNLIANNMDRFPLIKGDCSVVMVSNLLFNSGTNKFVEIADDYDSGPSVLTAVSNLMIAGANTPEKAFALKVHHSTKVGSKVYFRGNVSSGREIAFGTDFDPQIASEYLWHDSIRVHDAGSLKKRLIRLVGARPRDRDSVDRRAVDDVLEGKGRIISSQKDVGGWTVTAMTKRPFDAPVDFNLDDDSNGYTRLEERLHEMSRNLERNR